MKFTAVAPSNVAFIKYWGKKDEILRLPENGSISMNLSNLLTTTTVEFSDEYTQDEIIINGEIETGEKNRAIEHVDRIRQLSNSTKKAKVVSKNNFPIGTGLSSSASGFAALTVAGAKAAGLNLSEKKLSILARQGSGSACRSIPSGIVEWLDGETNETSYAESLYNPEYWDIVDIISVVNEGRKKISTTEGHTLIHTSPFFETRVKGMQQKISNIKDALKKKDFTQFGEIIEAEALNMHAVMITSNPALLYWTPGTLHIMKLVQQWRKDGLEVYFTINTGQDIHLITEKNNATNVENKLKEVPEVKDIIVSNSAEGTKIIDTHLF